MKANGKKMSFGIGLNSLHDRSSMPRRPRRQTGFAEIARSVEMRRENANLFGRTSLCALLQITRTSGPFSLLRHT